MAAAMQISMARLIISKVNGNRAPFSPKKYPPLVPGPNTPLQ